MPRPAPHRSRLATLAAIVALLCVAAVALAGCSKPAASAAPSATTAAPAATAPTSKPAASGAQTGSAGGGADGTSPASKSGSSTAGPAWRNADPAWMDKYKGLLIDGFKPNPGYKAVALTFDDGPNGETAYVINTLKKYGGQATFFDTGRKLAMGWAKSQPAIIWRAGSELGNHTQHHTINNTSSMWRRTYAVDLAEINGPDVFAMKGTGRNTVWLRPMGGMIDPTGMKAAADTNHLVVNWTVDSNDSHGGPRTADYIYEQCTNNIKSGDVVLLHVTHPESMAALPRICETLDKQGFKLVTLSELAQNSTGAITQKIQK
jgi:peptidoglycan/xylan/chitin deacetylase (PgdA/CDA1 family)